jgi:hypothetical protein
MSALSGRLGAAARGRRRPRRRPLVADLAADLAAASFAASFAAALATALATTLAAAAAALAFFLSGATGATGRGAGGPCGAFSVPGSGPQRPPAGVLVSWDCVGAARTVGGGRGAAWSF